MSDKDILHNILEFFDKYQKELQKCCDNDWEFNTTATGNGVSPFEANDVVKDLKECFEKIRKGEKVEVFDHVDPEEDEE